MDPDMQNNPQVMQMLAALQANQQGSLGSDPTMRSALAMQNAMGNNPMQPPGPVGPAGTPSPYDALMNPPPMASAPNPIY